MSKFIKSIFSFFKNKKRKLTPKEKNELALERARQISDKMAQDKIDSRNLFLQKILENAKAYNEARADFDDETKEDKE